MGGTDDPDNLIELSVEEHSLAHKKLFEEHGNEFDRIAWLALSGMIGKEEIIHLTAVESGRKYGTPKGYAGSWNKCMKAGPDNNIRSGENNPMWGKKHSEETRKKMGHPGNSGGHWTPERREKARQKALKQWTDKPFTEGQRKRDKKGKFL